MRYLLLCLSLVAFGAVLLASHYHGKATEWRAVAQQSQQLLKQQEDAINEMQKRQRAVAALDAKYTKDLVDAQTTIDKLQRDVASGRKRLQLNAACTKQSATGTASLDDAARARLSDTAERDYFILRSRIELAGEQIAGLQHYIQELCLK
ncbi:lysis protein [Pantoea sp. UBA5035]|uniref:lysis protein n=1 Tax=Pantoea sp. UBA5035 TaxID=1947035 RepID=UPI0020640AC5|nr:MAG TPA: Rz lysis protein [Bacteriophage sp.]